MTLTPQAFNSPLIKNRLLAFLLPSLLLIISAVLVNLAANQIKAYQQNLIDINLKTQTLEDAQSLNQYLNENLTILEQMSIALPSESMMVSVVQDFESIIKFYDPNATLKFSGQTPIKVGQDLVIPVIVALNSSPQQLANLLDQIMTLPYITQLISLETKINSDTAQSVINLRIYVQDPFIGY